MAVQLFVGRPGSGKSYGVVENVIMPAVKTARLIYTNIPLNLEEIYTDYPDSYGTITQFTNDQVNGDFLMSIPGGAIIIIDECWRFWPAGVKVTDIPLTEKEFFSEHRHKAGQDQLTQEIVLVTQSPSQIAKFTRDLVDQTVLTIKADKVGLKNQYQVQIYSACIPSIERPGTPNTTGMGTYKADIYKYYKSHTKSETTLPGIEIKADKRGSIWTHWYIRYVAPVVLIGSIWGAYFIFTFFTGDAFAKKNETQSIERPLPLGKITEISDNKTIEARQIVEVKIEKPVSMPSLKMRIVGHVEYEGHRTILVEHSEKRHLIKITEDRCAITVNGYECEYNNEIVTQFTGVQEDQERQPPTLTSMVPKV